MIAGSFKWKAVPPDDRDFERQFVEVRVLRIESSQEWNQLVLQMLR